jgi:hypothetical protein
MMRTLKTLPCDFQFQKNGKLYCKTHKCHLMYIYRVPSNKFSFAAECASLRNESTKGAIAPKKEKT